MRKNLKTILIAGLFAGVSPAALMAQVPSQRPGLDIYNTTPQVPAQGSGSQAPFSTQAQAPTQPTTQLVQHQYDPTQAAAQTSGQSPDGFFYVEDGAKGPGDLANGLSSYNSQTMSQAGSQLEGNYGSIQRSSLPSGQAQKAWTNPFKNMSQGQDAPGNVRYQWSADLVMPVRLRAGVITNIILPDWEKAKDAMIGDGTAVEAKIVRSNVIAVRALSVGTDTSMTVIGGSGNVYTFYLRTEGRNSTVLTDFQVFVQASPSKSSGDWFNSENAPAQTPAATGTTAPGSITLKDSASQGDEPVPQDRRVFKHEDV